ncbi:hypothetical protein [Leekyejoonella antrihumi]|uniref:hypothetical protein n=1 Tax=Leekyejoonella antrihumi TaxID=1660198 RepID=UPI001C98379F|nr:hypothetical protein [Leekyejoonella antrihumi]
MVLERPLELRARRRRPGCPTFEKVVVMGGQSLDDRRVVKGHCSNGRVAAPLRGDGGQDDHRLSRAEP